MIQEQITKAQQCAALLVDDIQQAWASANNARRPEGPSLGDKAMAAYLSDCLQLARNLESKLLLLSP